MYFLIGCNFKYHISTNNITLYDAYIYFYPDKKYKVAAAEHISYDWVKEDILNKCSRNSSRDNAVFC